MGRRLERAANPDCGYSRGTSKQEQAMTLVTSSRQSTDYAKKILIWLMKYAFLIAFGGLIIFFGTQTDTFLNGQNLVNILKGAVIVLMIALALTLVISSGGIDLSVGTALDFGAWFAIVAMATYGLPWPIAVLCALAGGSMVGLLNAFLIVKLGVTPFLATLGTFFIGRSVQQIGTSGGANVNFRGAPDGFTNLTAGLTFGISNLLLIGLLVLGFFYFFVERSKHGRRINALGLQDSAAKVAGIPTNRYRVLVYIMAGATAAIGGVMLSSGLSLFTPMAGFSYLLDGIAAVFIGASMHAQHRPNVLGTLVGVLFLGVLGTGLDLMGIDFNTKAALKGVILLVAIALASLVSRKLPDVQDWLAKLKKSATNV
jgi:ribose transport system permease protein